MSDLKRFNSKKSSKRGDGGFDNFHRSRAHLQWTNLKIKIMKPFYSKRFESNLMEKIQKLWEIMSYNSDTPIFSSKTGLATFKFLEKTKNMVSACNDPNVYNIII